MTSGGNRNPANPETGGWMDRMRRRRFTPKASFTHGRGTNPNGSRQVRAQCNSALRSQRRVGRHHWRTPARLRWPRLLLALLARTLAGRSHQWSIPLALGGTSIIVLEHREKSQSGYGASVRLPPLSRRESTLTYRVRSDDTMAIIPRRSTHGDHSTRPPRRRARLGRGWPAQRMRDLELREFTVVNDERTSERSWSSRSCGLPHAGKSIVRPLLRGIPRRAVLRRPVQRCAGSLHAAVAGGSRRAEHAAALQPCVGDVPDLFRQRRHPDPWLGAAARKLGRWNERSLRFDSLRGSLRRRRRGPFGHGVLRPPAAGLLL